MSSGWPLRGEGDFLQVAPASQEEEAPRTLKALIEEGRQTMVVRVGLSVKPRRRG